MLQYYITCCYVIKTMITIFKCLSVRPEFINPIYYIFYISYDYKDSIIYLFIYLFYLKIIQFNKEEAAGMLHVAPTRMTTMEERIDGDDQE